MQRPWSGVQEAADRVHRAAVPHLGEVVPILGCGLGGDHLGDVERRAERRVDEIGRESPEVREQSAERGRDVGAVILEEMTPHAFQVVVHHERGVGGVAERACRGPLIHQLEAPLGQLQAFGHLLAPDQHGPRAHAVLVSVEEFPGRGHPAEEVRAFQDKHFRATLGQHIRGH